MAAISPIERARQHTAFPRMTKLTSACIFTIINRLESHTDDLATCAHRVLITNHVVRDGTSQQRAFIRCVIFSLYSMPALRSRVLGFSERTHVQILIVRDHLRQDLEDVLGYSVIVDTDQRPWFGVDLEAFVET